MTLPAGIVVVLFSLFLVGLSAVIFAKPAFAERFLRSFASSARAHYLEQALRLLVGSALVVRSPVMWQPRVFWLIGWTIVVTSTALIVLPWQWHQRFGVLMLPAVLRFMKLYAIGLFVFGSLLLYALFPAGPHIAT
jgi:hypothetical protein